MNKTIKFGECSATINAGEHRAMLTVEIDKLPVELADALNNVGDLRATEVFKNDKGEPCIRLLHDLSNSDLMNAICEAIQTVYNCDIVVCNERGK